MAQNYYIRLPFYLTNGTTPKTVNIKFDNEVISVAEITAVSADVANIVNFSVSKEPGIYEISISPEVIGQDDTTVCLDDIWISNDNVNFYSMLMNVHPIETTLPGEEFGFNPAKGALLWADIQFVTGIELPNLENWNNIYKNLKLKDIEDKIALIKSYPGHLTDEALVNMQLACDLFAARGYK